MIISNIETAPIIPFELDARILFSDKRTELIHIMSYREEYYKYLQSDHWKNLRLLAFKEYGRHCFYHHMASTVNR